MMEKHFRRLSKLDVLKTKVIIRKRKTKMDNEGKKHVIFSHPSLKFEHHVFVHT